MRLSVITFTIAFVAWVDGSSPSPSPSPISSMESAYNSLVAATSGSCDDGNTVDVPFVLHLKDYGTTSDSEFNTCEDTLTMSVAEILSSKTACVNTAVRRLLVVPYFTGHDIRRLSTTWATFTGTVLVSPDTCADIDSCISLLSASASTVIPTNLCSVNGLCGVSVASVDEYSTTTTTTSTVTTEDGGGAPWWAWFFLLLMACACLMCCAMVVISSVRGSHGSYEYGPEDYPLMNRGGPMYPGAMPMTTPMNSLPVSTVPMGVGPMMGGGFSPNTARMF